MKKKQKQLLQHLFNKVIVYKMPKVYLVIRLVTKVICMYIDI